MKHILDYVQKRGWGPEQAAKELGIQFRISLMLFRNVLSKAQARGVEKKYKRAVEFPSLYGEINDTKVREILAAKEFYGKMFCAGMILDDQYKIVSFTDKYVWLADKKGREKYFTREDFKKEFLEFVPEEYGRGILEGWVEGDVLVADVILHGKLVRNVKFELKQ